MQALAIRVIVVVCAVTVMAQALALWWHTGRAGLTRYYDPERARIERTAAAMDALFEPNGDGPSAPRAPTNSFALGLLPSGLDRHFLSVATFGGPALLTIGVVTCRPGAARASSACRE